MILLLIIILKLINIINNNSVSLINNKFHENPFGAVNAGQFLDYFMIIGSGSKGVNKKINGFK